MGRCMGDQTCLFQGTSSTHSKDQPFYSWTLKASLQARWTFFIILLYSMRLSLSHYTSAEKLILPSFALAGFSLSTKHGLATFVHERLKSSLKLKTDVQSSQRVQTFTNTIASLLICQCSLTRFYAGDLNCPHADWSYGADSADGDCLAGWTSINSLALLYNPRNSGSFNSGWWNTGTNPHLAFANVD